MIGPLTTTAALANTEVAPSIEITQTSPTPAQPTAPTSPDAAAERVVNTGLVEQVDYINACRRTNRSVEVFADTALSPVNRVGSLAANTSVFLTGVLAPGRAQIARRDSPTSSITVVGWVNAANLTTCDAPVPIRACYGINVDNLSVRSAPSSTSAFRGSLRAGSIVYATANPPREQVSPNAPPDFGRIWVEILQDGQPAWIARTGQSGLGSNATRLSDTACNP
ncbi:hypothetical protein [Thermocoleostomius sinensis]|uniref:SH3 domain-containing protein n=1 Tax=Thermocoleostomius sinensis A174 TaxID=2016057 RepID=A0A9E9CAP5_9CYAN|nr:hypothetical protein [Thermocoleostomius sinensis]WAL59195.1 hypothetical protein OXH18_18750 [Thermocoleostomius sinensis A174]